MSNLDSNDKDLLVEISVMYYLEGKTQSEISKELFISRPKVSRLLNRARELNIVEIKINYESDDLNRVSRQIQQRFGVENVVIVKTLSTEAETVKEIGKAAALELDSIITDGVRIGMSWGRTVKAMVDAFKEKHTHNVKIVELFGMVEYGEASQELLSIGFELSKKVSGSFYSLPSPLYINDKKTRDILLENPVINNTVEMLDKCDYIVTGLGVVKEGESQRIWDAHIDNKTREELLELGAKGYLCAHFFDHNGLFIKHPINDNIIGIKIDTIRNKKVFLVAGGLNKVEAIHAVLRSGYVNKIVSDDKTLKAIIEMDKHQED